MKLIINNTDLSNKDIGIILDKMAEEQDTIYYGKTDTRLISYGKKMIRVDIKYLKKYVKIKFDLLLNIKND